MLVIDVTVPKGRFSPGERDDLASRLTAGELLSGDRSADIGVDPGVLALYESLTHVVVREVDTWIAGGRRARDADAPTYLVNVLVGAWGKEMAAHLIKRVTAAVEAFEGVPGRLSREPAVLVHVIPLAEGAYGLYGRPLGVNEYSDMIEAAKTGTTREAPDGTYVDPTCGAIVPADEAVTLDLDGTTYGFCCPHCRGRFAKRNGQKAAR